ncbi:MAG: methylmalonyl Co-A mutase-associated GTPase MeaB [Candidatus Cloacimonetes bacterium 4572_55]|nr:MAG: methylmalonyl Co-A mutase-associated GTPase MeaB [Candidatus Cloacimonetes bacterium 4572_55]
MIDGQKSGHDETQKRYRKRTKLSVDNYVQGVLNRDRVILARTVTLVESNSKSHNMLAQQALQKLLPHTGNSIRLGITGVPGVGKSSFIERLGYDLCEQGHRVAVLAIDPSSSVTRGSILGDKTRMTKLARHPNAFIRPSPTGGALGGVTRKSRETIWVCEAAGFDVILVETVGVGQSEITVRSMVDFFLLLMLSGSGDELQGIKKGVIELADALVINKADGDNKIKAEAAKNEYNRALHYLQPVTEGWSASAYTCSALTGEGISEIWRIIQKFNERTTDSGVFGRRRRSQLIDWTRSMIKEHLQERFFNHPEIVRIRPKIENAVVQGEMPATTAVKKLLDAYEK